MSSSLRHSSVTLARVAPPPATRLWGELASIARLDRRVPPPRRDRAERHAGAPVLVIPGFLSTDASTATLRRRLDDAGYAAHGWGMGMNLGATTDRLDRVIDRIGRIADHHGRPVVLIGWSLGGLFAREAAKASPGAVDRVITLGSPFSGDPRANHAWRLYEWINRHPVDRLPFECDLAQKPPVPTIAFWSRRDGIVAEDCARGMAHERDRAVEVGCTHIGFTYDAAAIDAVIGALA